MKRNWFLWTLVVVISVVIIYRAYIIPFTHDEAGTWLTYRHMNLWPCFFSASCWATANNHWLNSLLMQWSGVIGGDIPGVLRWPSELAGVLYLVAAALLVSRYIKNYAWQIFGFLLLCAHVYLIDFFSLARGYGMMAAGTIWGIYGLFRYEEQYEIRWLYVWLGAIFLAVLANFTSLIPFAAICSTWLVWVLINKRYQLIWKHGIFLLGAVLMLFILLRLPLKILSGSGEFEWGADNLRLMSNDLFVNLLANGTYWGWHSVNALMNVILIAIVLIFLAFILFEKDKINSPLSISLLLFGVVLFTLLSLLILTDSKAPIGRKSIFLIPFIFLIPAFSQRLIRNKHVSTVGGVIGSYLVLSHFFFTTRDVLRSSREWYYDAYYPELLTDVLPQHRDSPSVAIGASWIFIPSLSFYRLSQSLPITGLAYQKELVIDSTMDYYFIQQEDVSKIDSTLFVLDHRIGPFFLFRKNTLSAE